MTTSTTTTTATTTFTYEYSEAFGAYVVIVNGLHILRDALGAVRTFATPNSARKRIARERSGNFHN